MGEEKKGQHRRRICVGLLAHVDAGKTTLAEAILYKTGSIRKLGRVDHQDACLDNFELERARGITIFSKQAEVSVGTLDVTLVDTPGHVDFSAEMERTLQILDYAVLVISGADGVQSHVETLWRLLKRYEIPTVLFINKMDQPGTDRALLLAELRKKLDERCVDFSVGTDGSAGWESEELWQEWQTRYVEGLLADGDFQENLALCDEALLEAYLQGVYPDQEKIAELIAQRCIFPCFFGSALRLHGVEMLLAGLSSFCRMPEYPAEFAARVFKITRDGQGNRLTHMKITGGSLKVKALLSNSAGSGQRKENASGAEEERWEEKVNQIRIYSGASFHPVQEAKPGMVCAVTGLTHTRSGEGLGAEPGTRIPILEPVLSWQILLPEGCDVPKAYQSLRQLEEEEPELHITWNRASNEICAQLMGEVQIEVLKAMVRERFDLAIEFGKESIVYRETLAEPVIGMGHFEPLRHYAEVHLLMEPGERGSGLQFATACREEQLARNWQRLILTHLEERQHPGVLTGSDITDLRITLIAGKAHLKHTEGGDFRQATYRAVRQGLKRGVSVLLEPVYEFRMELPAEAVGRAMTDIQKRCGTVRPPQLEGDMAVLTGSAPVASMRGYQTELMSYTKGRGRLSCVLKGYELCHNQEEVVAACGYDSERDTENPTGSVFCAHGAGFVVSWELVPEYVHLDPEGTGDAEEDWLSPDGGEDAQQDPAAMRGERKRRTAALSGCTGGAVRQELSISQEEVDEIFARTYGAQKRERSSYKKSRRLDFTGSAPPARKEPMDEYLLVDGYNIIFAWEELKALSETSAEAARTKLMDILSDYQGSTGVRLILVFDAYRVEGGQGSTQKYHNIYVVYTKEAETADQYIEKTVHEIGRKHRVTVATSDALEQVIILGQGGYRMSARGLREEIARARAQVRLACADQPDQGRQYLFSGVSKELHDQIEELRTGNPSSGEGQEDETSDS